MKRSLLQATITIGLAATAVPAFAGGHFGGFARGFPVRMAARPPAPARMAPPPRVAVTPPNAIGPARLAFAPRQIGGDRLAGRFFGERPRDGFERGRFDRRFGERGRRWRGRLIFPGDAGTGYPYFNPDYSYPTSEPDISGAAPYAPAQEDFRERYVPSALGPSPQSQAQFNAGPRIITVHEQRTHRRAGPLPTVIYGIHPRPDYNDVPSAPPLY